MIYNDLIIPRHINRYNYYISRTDIDDDVIVNHHLYNINLNNTRETIVKRAFMELNIVRHIIGKYSIYAHILELCFKVACQRIIKLLN